MSYDITFHMTSYKALQADNILSLKKFTEEETNYELRAPNE